MYGKAQKTPGEQLELDELMDYLHERGFTKLLDALSDQCVYTQTGRLNMTGLARRMDVQIKVAKSMMARLREEAKG